MKKLRAHCAHLVSAGFEATQDIPALQCLPPTSEELLSLKMYVEITDDFETFLNNYGKPNATEKNPNLVPESLEPDMTQEVWDILSGESTSSDQNLNSEGVTDVTNEATVEVNKKTNQSDADQTQSTILNGIQSVLTTAPITESCTSPL